MREKTKSLSTASSEHRKSFLILLLFPCSLFNRLVRSASHMLFLSNANQVVFFMLSVLWFLQVAQDKAAAPRWDRTHITFSLLCKCDSFCLFAAASNFKSFRQIQQFSTFWLFVAIRLHIMQKNTILISHKRGGKQFSRTKNNIWLLCTQSALGHIKSSCNSLWMSDVRLWTMRPLCSAFPHHLGWSHS